jgi:hypothetical protein
MEISEIIELVTGIMNATKRREDGSLELDKNKLMLLGATFAGQQVLSRWQQGRQRKALLKAERLGLTEKDLRKLQKKRGKWGRNLTFGTVVGVVGYLLVMKPEQRTELFKSIDNAITELSNLINEFQGKPATESFAKPENA